MPVPSNIAEARREAGLAPPQSAKERIQHAWRLTARYFVSSDWKAAWGLLLCYIALEAGTIYILVWTNKWQRDFYDTIEQRASGAFLTLVATYILILAIQVGLTAVNSLVTWTLSIRWRNWLTAWYMGRWFARDRFYEIERLRLIDNPDQRIAEDVKNFTSMTTSSPLVIFVNLVSSVVTAIGFGVILMETSRPIEFALLGRNVSLPGDLIWYSVVYVVLGSVLITYIGKPYIRRRMREQHYEADFRAGLIHVRRNGEQIAFAGTQGLERRGLAEAFANIRKNWFQLMWTNIGLNAGTGIYQRVMSVAPLFLLVPRFFTGQISFGQVMAGSNAFSTFTGTLSYFVQAYPTIAGQVANINRLKALDDSIDLERPRGISFSAGTTEAGVAIASEKLSLRRPHGAPLLHVGDWTVRDGERWVIEGPSGVGKTTLLRAIAGLWPDGDGAVAMTNRGTAMLVPQRLYIPLGTLKDAVCFPDCAGDHDDAAITALLEKVRLGAHVDTMHEVRMWQEELSPGEQQRLALARILLHNPDLLVLDESTSALDADNARYFHETLLEAMPALTLVSVVHDEQMTRFHTHRLSILDGVASPGLIEHAR